MLKILKKIFAFVIGGFVFVFTTVVGLLAGFFSEVVVSQLPDNPHEPAKTIPQNKLMNANQAPKTGRMDSASKSHAN